MQYQSDAFDINQRRGDPREVERTPGGQLWETWRLNTEQKLCRVNSANEDRALLEQAMREQ
jgi:hypothetical protein